MDARYWLSAENCDAVGVVSISAASISSVMWMASTVRLTDIRQTIAVLVISTNTSWNITKMENEAPAVVKELFVMVGMLSAVKRMPRPRRCEICGVMKDNWLWHMKLAHDGWKPRGEG